MPKTLHFPSLGLPLREALEIDSDILPENTPYNILCGMKGAKDRNESGPLLRAVFRQKV